jgi:hypothetical protein
MTPSGNRIGKFELRVIDKLSGNGDPTNITEGQEDAAEFRDDRWTDPALAARHRPDTFNLRSMAAIFE